MFDFLTKFYFSTKSHTKLVLICLIVLNNLWANGQGLNDKLLKPIDTSKKVVDSFTLTSASNDIDAKIVYEAEDSIVYDVKNKKMYLFNQSKIEYTNMLIESYFITYDWINSLLSANLYRPSEDSIVGRPYMKQDGKDYYTDKLLYNFKSKKGKVYDIVTKENDALLHGHEVKKDSAGNWFISQAKYTTCDLEHPHFYFNAKKLKLTTKKSIVTGPTNLVVNDVQTPLYLPFGIFPAQNGRRSGIILPQQYGFSPYFNMQNMGFYLAINDYVDAKFMLDLYFNGSYRYNASTRYNKLYKFDGEFMAETNRIFQGDVDDPSVKSSTPSNYIFSWRHTQSAKAHPTFTFNTSLTFMTQGAINRSLTLNASRYNGQINSSLNATKRFRKIPLLINGGISYTQDLANKNVSGYLPSLRINYNGNLYQNPNNSKSVIVGLQYATEAIASFSKVGDSTIFTGEFLKNLSYGVKHSAIFSFQNIKLFNNISVVPNLRYTDRFFFERIDVTRDAAEKIPDTVLTKGFYTARDFSGGVSLNTVLIGIMPLSKKGIMQGLRHQMTPNASFSYTPNFGTDFWGYFGKYNDSNNVNRDYFHYVGPYTDISRGAAAMLSFGINNAFEGKFRNKKDSLTGTKKMMLLDALNFGSSYNFIADSFKLSDFNLSFSNSTLRFLNFSGSMNFSPYVWENGVRKDRYKIAAGEGLFRFTNLSTTANFMLSSNDISRRVLNSKKGSEYERNYIYRHYQYFYDFNSPWNLSMSFNVNLQRGFTINRRNDTTVVNASLVLNNFDFNITPKWKIAISSGYDFNVGQIGLTTISAIRDMHCWEFRVNYVPISNIGQAYTIEIRPKSTLLQDLKLTRNKPAVENFF